MRGKLIHFVFFFGMFSCNSPRKISLVQTGPLLTGSGFYKKAAAMNWKERDSLALEAVFQGNVPPFLLKFAPVSVTMIDSLSGKRIRATYFISPDYLSVGSGDDWARISITPMAAQRIADSLGCFLPTRKMVDDIYHAAAIQLEPVPMFAFRDSTPTMWQHHLVIEGQRMGRRGIIAGIKKDVVISGRLSRDPRPDRVAIYGWHSPGGKPIQPLYTGHVNRWVDYSQGIRLVLRKLRVEGRWMDYREVLKHDVYRKLLCDEEFCDFYGY